MAGDGSRGGRTCGKRLAVVVLAVALASTTLGLGGAAQAAAPHVTAEGAVLWDPAEDTVLYGKQETVARPMASTTKIMTVLLALERGDVDETVEVSADAASRGGASLGLHAGEELPLGSLLAGLVVRSGNDGAVAVAEHIAGDEAAFVEAMNARAEELGLSETHFVNPSGLTDNVNHHASPVDLARLAETAMQLEKFAAWAGAARLTVPGLGTMRNRNELLRTYPGATGVKTGYTALAGQTLVASASRDGRTLYAVVLDSEARAADAAALLDYGFSDFRRPAPLAAGRHAVPYRWADAATPLVAEESLAATVPSDVPVVWRLRLQPVHQRPVSRGERLGQAVLVVDGEVRDTTPLWAAEPVAAPEPRSSGALAGAALHEALRAMARAAPLDRSPGSPQAGVQGGRSGG